MQKDLYICIYVILYIFLKLQINMIILPRPFNKKFLTRPCQGMMKTELCNKWQETGTCPSVTTASSLTASLSYVLSSGPHATRPSFAGWSLPATPVPTATGATSATLSPTKRGPSCSPHLHVDRYYNIFQLYTTTYLYNTSPSS